MLKKYAWLIIIILFVAFKIGEYFYKKPKFINGEAAIEFNAVLQDQRTFELADLKGKYVLLDFWGSWCGPCRQQSGKLVAFYDKFKDAEFKNATGFEIVSIAIETNEKRWQKALQKDGKYWEYQIMDKATSLRFFDSPIAGLYGIKQVPSKYLINEKGVIMGVDLSFEQMDKLLTSRKL